MSFELIPYKHPHTGGRPESHIAALTLSKNGTIRFNSLLTSKLREWNVEAFLLLWDKTNLRIGFKPVGKGDPRAYRLAGVSRKKTGYLDIAARSFFRSTGISVPTRAYVIPVDIGRSVEMITIDLPKELTVGEPYGNGFNVVRP